MKATPAGGIPGQLALPQERRTSEYRCRFKPHVVESIERAREKMSRKIGETISYAQAVERLFTEYLGDKPYDEAAEKIRQEAERDLLAGKLLEEPLVQQARDVARRLGLLPEVGGSVAESGPGCDGAASGCAAESEPGCDVATSGGAAEGAAAGEPNRQIATAELEEALSQALGGDLPLADLVEPAAPLAVPGVTTPVVEPGIKPGLKPAVDDVHSAAPCGCRSCCEVAPIAALHSDIAASHMGQPAGPDIAASHVGQPAGPDIVGPKGEATADGTATATIINDLMARLRFNPESRFVTAAQRAALIRRDGYCCSTPGCRNRTWLHIHHIVLYCEGGKTLPDYLITLCSRCHKNVHEGKLRITGTVSAGLVFTDAQGRDLARRHKLERAIWLDYWKGWSGRKTDSFYARALGFSDAA